MDALTTHHSSVVLSPYGFWHRCRIMCRLLPLQHSVRTFCFYILRSNPHKRKKENPTAARHIDTNTPFYMPVENTVNYSEDVIRLYILLGRFHGLSGLLCFALEQIIEASLHGHNFWNSNCYLIWLHTLWTLHLRGSSYRCSLHAATERAAVWLLILLYLILCR